ncbi:uncharacterized protein LOC111328789 isoform X2 [Stylophora pistillata]|uniref:uncharacterized protein LOC111328789 isoform X2 n=1 Tax=Stylophora pistillata TaxID=50429 RepID=UPI000C052077|nr:uncharacterized protein LOC111328789 isoform X2 [Stylophora pistillata]
MSFAVIYAGSKLRSIQTVLRSNLEFIEQFSLCLDREMRSIPNWRHLAAELEVDVDVIRRLEQYRDFSPTIRLFEYLEQKRPDLTIRHLKDAFVEIKRNDLVRLLAVEASSGDSEKVKDAIRADLLDEIALALDDSSLVLSNWKTLAVKLGVSRDACREMERQSMESPAGKLFQYLATSLPEMTLSSLKKALESVERGDLINFLLEQNLGDDVVLKNIIVPGSDLHERMTQELNREGPGIKNWRHVASKLKIPAYVYGNFADFEQTRKSPTKKILEWVVARFPGKTLSDLAEALDKIQRNDAIQIISKYYPDTVDLALEKLSSSSQESVTMPDSTDQVICTSHKKTEHGSSKESFTMPDSTGQVLYTSHKKAEHGSRPSQDLALEELSCSIQESFTKPDSTDLALEELSCLTQESFTMPDSTGQVLSTNHKKAENGSRPNQDVKVEEESGYYGGLSDRTVLVGGCDTCEGFNVIYALSLKTADVIVEEENQKIVVMASTFPFGFTQEQFEKVFGLPEADNFQKRLNCFKESNLLRYDRRKCQYFLNRSTIDFLSLKPYYRKAKSIFTRHYSDLAVSLCKTFLTKDCKTAIDQYRSEKDNIREAMAWCGGDHLELEQTVRERAIAAFNEAATFLAKVMPKQEFQSLFYKLACRCAFHMQLRCACLTNIGMKVVLSCTCTPYICPRALNQAKEILTRANELQSTAKGVCDATRAQCLSKLGFCYVREGRVEKGFEYIDVALKLRKEKAEKSKRSKDEVMLAACINDLAASQMVQRNHMLAIHTRLQHVLPVYEKNLGDHPFTATTINWIGNSYHALGDYDNAIKYIGKSVEMRAKLLGPHQETARSLYDLGVAFTAKQNYETALKYLEEAVGLQEEVLDTYDELIYTHQAMSIALLGLGRIEEAEEEMKRSVECAKKLDSWEAPSEMIGTQELEFDWEHF